MDGGLGARVLGFEGNSFGVFKSCAGSSPADSMPPTLRQPRRASAQRGLCLQGQERALLCSGQFEPGTRPPTQVIIVTIFEAIRLLADPVPSCHTRPPNLPQMEMIFRT